MSSQWRVGRWGIMKHPPENRAERRILVVDDDPAVGRSLGRVLRAAGYAVDWVESGAAAIQAVEQRAYDLVILDWNLPDQDGPTVAATLRALGAPRIVFLTGRGSPADATDEIVAYESGADVFLRKPCPAELMRAVIAAQLRRPTTSSVSAWRVGRITVDEHAGTVRVDDETREGTRLVIRALVALARRSPEMLTRDELIDDIWLGARVSRAALRRLLSRLRDL